VPELMGIVDEGALGRLKGRSVGGRGRLRGGGEVGWVV